MSELTLTVLRLGLLALLWVFIFAVVGVLRTDLYGTQVSRRSQRKTLKKQEKADAKAAKAARAGGAIGAAGAAGAGAAGAGAVGAPGAGAAGAPGAGVGVGGVGQPRSAVVTPAEQPAAKGRRGRGRSVPTTLVVTEGPLAGTSLPLRGAGVLIGRNPECALILDDDYASGRHCRVYHDGSRWMVEDLGSTNGTWLGKDKLTTARPVQVGSTLRIGQTVLELRS